MSAYSPNTGETDRELILSQLLLLQGTMPVMPTVEGLAEFTQQAIRSVPGVSSVHICTAGRPNPPHESFAAICDVCGIGKNGSEAIIQASCGLRDRSLFRSVLLRTQLGPYGYLNLGIDDEKRFTPFAQHVENVANVLATNIENKAYKKRMEMTNLSLQQEVAEVRAAEDKINALLREKELLLKEVHHRIKNNMSSIMSLLSLQADALKNPEAVAVLLEARARLRSMGVLYDKLYRSETMREMSLKDYLPSLVDEIVGVFPNRGMVKVEKSVGDIVLGVKILSPLGIIVNELITNAMKHAFAGKESGLINVSASAKDGRVTLVVEDDGNGLPESVDIANSSGFGFHLVSMLTAQIDGAIQIERRKRGARFVLEFDA